MALTTPTMIIAMPHNAEPYPIEKLEAHIKGIRHHAISVFVICGDRMLIQQRALHKYHSGGRWANACCSHPSPSETAADCAARRTGEELGITLPMQHIGTYDYHADVGDGLIEWEFVDVFIAEVENEAVEFNLNPDEVAATLWMTASALDQDMVRHPDNYTEWFKIYMASNESVMQRIRQRMSN